jgi:hypothetical protein
VWLDLLHVNNNNNNSPYYYYYFVYYLIRIAGLFQYNIKVLNSAYLFAISSLGYNYFSAITSYSPPPPLYLKSIHSRHRDILDATETPTTILAFLLSYGSIKTEKTLTRIYALTILCSCRPSLNHWLCPWWAAARPMCRLPRRPPPW